MCTHYSWYYFFGTKQTQIFKIQQQFYCSLHVYIVSIRPLISIPSFIYHPTKCIFQIFHLVQQECNAIWPSHLFKIKVISQMNKIQKIFLHTLLINWIGKKRKKKTLQVKFFFYAIIILFLDITIQTICKKTLISEKEKTDTNRKCGTNSKPFSQMFWNLRDKWNGKNW